MRLELNWWPNAPSNPDQHQSAHHSSRVVRLSFTKDSIVKHLSILLVLSTMLSMDAAEAAPDRSRTPTPSTADEYQPSLKATPIELVWAPFKDGVTMVLPNARIVKAPGTRGYEAVGIGFHNGFSCSGLIPPYGPWNLTCGSERRAYSMSRDPQTKQLKLELLTME